MFVYTATTIPTTHLRRAYSIQEFVISRVCCTFPESGNCMLISRLHKHQHCHSLKIMLHKRTTLGLLSNLGMMLRFSFLMLGSSKKSLCTRTESERCSLIIHYAWDRLVFLLHSTTLKTHQFLLGTVSLVAAFHCTHSPTHDRMHSVTLDDQY